MTRDISKCGHHGRVVGTRNTGPNGGPNGGSRQASQGFTNCARSKAAGESGSNGFIERAVRSIKVIEARIGDKLNISQCSICWKIQHCAGILNKCEVGKDGSRMKGKKYGGCSAALSCCA